MRRKTFILTFLMMMFCSMGFGQTSKWGVPDTHCESTMTMITQIKLDGVIQGSDVEIAAFCGETLRGTVRPDSEQMNMVYLVIHGNNAMEGEPAEVISFRFYDHAAGRELFYPYADVEFEENKKIGDIEFLDTTTGEYSGDNLIDLTSIAEVEGVKYGSLQAAVDAAPVDETVVLLKDATGAGVVINKNVTINFGGFKYSFNEGVGSTGTKTLGMQILQGKTVTLKNGKLEVAEGCGELFGMLVQNYANLTVEDMTLDGDRLDRNDYSYVLSNNSGTVNIIGATNIYANTTENESHFAFDVCKYSSYEEPTVNVNTTGTIKGAIEVTTTSQNNLNISGGTFTTPIQEAWCANGYIPVDNGDGTYTVKVGKFIAQTETGAKYETLQAAVDAGETVTLLSDAIGAGVVINKDVTINFNEKTYTVNQAVGSSGTATLGFQILKGNDVTLTNGTLTSTAVTSGKEVKMLVQNYADLTLTNMNLVDATEHIQYVLSNNSGISNINGSTSITTDAVAFDVYDYSSAGYAVPTVNVETTGTITGNIEVSESIEDNLNISGGKFTTPIQEAWCADGYIPTDLVDGYYGVEQGAFAAIIGETKYATLDKAIKAATAGQTITLLRNITEDVAVGKSVTIDGANFNYTGNILFEGNANSTVVTVKNVKFVNGTGYAIKTNKIKSITVEGCTVTNYGSGFLYANKSTPTVVVKNVTVEGGNYGMHWVYGTEASLENVTMTNVTYGLYIQNYAGKTINVEDCNISSIAIWERENQSGVQTFKFEGASTVGTLTDSQYAKYVLTATDATLTAPEGKEVTTNVEGYKVVYEDGKYCLKELVYVAQIGDVKYESLQEAVSASTEGDVIELINNISYDKNDIFTVDAYDYTTMVDATGKNVVIDLKGYMVEADLRDYTDLLYSIIFVGDNGSLTLKDSSEGRTGTIKATAGDRAAGGKNVYALILADTKNTTNVKLNIESGNYELDVTRDAGALIYVNASNILTVTGGNFYLGNAGTLVNNSPWIFNTYGNGINFIVVKGGNYNVSPVHYHGDVIIPVEYAVAETSDTRYPYSVVPAVAKIESKGYASIKDAVNAAQAGNTITVVGSHTLAETVIVNKNVNFEFAEGVQITAPAYSYENGVHVNPTAFRIVDNATVTVNSFNITSGDNGLYNFILGAADGATAGNLVINNGTFAANTSVASVTKGTLTIQGGDFSLVEGTTDYRYLINCIDANYTAGTAKVAIKGGTFHGFDPENNAAEGTGTNFCATGYVSDDNGNGTYTVREANYVAQIGEVKYESLQAAINAANDGNEIDVISHIHIDQVDGNTTQVATSDGTPITALYVVSGKSVTLDLNEQLLWCESEAENQLYTFFAVNNGGHLTIKNSDKDSDGVNDGVVEISCDYSAYSLLLCLDGNMTIENGNYKLAVGRNGGGMIYSQQDETVTVNGGKFELGNVGELSNGSPWIFNASGQNTRNIIVNGGTFNADILHQYYPFEVMAPKEKALSYDAVEELWTMVDAVAYVDEQHKSGAYYTNEVGYLTLAEAVEAAEKYNQDGNYVTTVTMLADVELTEGVVLEKNMNLNIDSKSISNVENEDVYPVIRIQGGANVTIKNGNITNDDYVFVLGASDGSSAGNLTIESGTYVGTTTVASVTKGTLTIKGGEFKTNEGEHGSTYLINCIDANYNNGSAKVSISGGKFHGFNPQDNAAETGGHTNFCAEGYAAVATSANVWEVYPVQSMTLETKWNWVSHYVVGSNDSDILNQLKSGLGEHGVQIKNQTQFIDYGTSSVTNTTGWWGNLESSSVKEMYKVNTNLESDETLEIKLAGKVADPADYPIELSSEGNGWNYIGYPMTQLLPIDHIFGNIVEEGDYIKSRDLFAEYYNGKWWGNLKNMSPGEGYMYQTSTSKRLTYSYSRTAEIAEANITVENNHWVPASSQYADNMTITAMLSIDGEMAADNYEVAAFVGGEVRGSARAIYVESLDAYMFFMTVHGEDVEEMTFKCYDLTTGEELELNNRVNYSSDAVLGSIREPYMLSFGVLSVDEMSSNAISIYPNPTTTGREINLAATCDTVEVFNALGVKIAEYQNVDTIDAIETAGIYVIRVTNNGNVQNCRLVVK